MKNLLGVGRADPNERISIKMLGDDFNVSKTGIVKINL